MTTDIDVNAVVQKNNRRDRASMMYHGGGMTLGKELKAPKMRTEDEQKQRQERKEKEKQILDGFINKRKQKPTVAGFGFAGMKTNETKTFEKMQMFKKDDISEEAK